jgi:hypothetical protein
MSPGCRRHPPALSSPQGVVLPTLLGPRQRRESPTTRGDAPVHRRPGVANGGDAPPKSRECRGKDRRARFRIDEYASKSAFARVRRRELRWSRGVGRWQEGDARGIRPLWRGAGRRFGRKMRRIGGARRQWRRARSMKERSIREVIAHLEAQTEQVTCEHVQTVLRRVSCTDVTLEALSLASTWTDRSMQATTYRKGGCCWRATPRIFIHRSAERLEPRAWRRDEPRVEACCGPSRRCSR